MEQRKVRFGEKAPGITSPMSFSGMKRTKYEQMLERRRDELEKMSLADVDEYLSGLVKRYQRRIGDLLPGCMESLGTSLDEPSKGMGWYDKYDQAMRMATEMSFREFMDA